MYFHAQSDYAVNGAVNARMNRMYKSRGTTGECQSGQAMVEFALVIVFVFLVFLSILQMILLMYAYNTFADAAKEGVRYAIVHGTGLEPPIVAGPEQWPPSRLRSRAPMRLARTSFQRL